LWRRPSPSLHLVTWGVCNVVYTDEPVDEDVPPLTADVEVVLEPGEAAP
jgi:hypothetical protein